MQPTLTDEATERRLRRQIPRLTSVFGVLSALTLLSPFLSTEWVASFSPVALGAYFWLLFLGVRYGLRAVWLNSTALLPLAVLALPSSLAACALTIEAMPDRGHARRELTRRMGGWRTGSLSRIYHTTRPMGSMHVDLFQFSVGSPEAGAKFLRPRGFSPSEAELKPWEIDYQPGLFPIPWMPFSVSSELQVWRAEDATGWLDSEHSVVYLVVYRERRPPPKP